MRNTVRIERVKQELTQAQLAARIGVSRQTVHAIESGKYVPSTVLALKMAKLFGVSVEALFLLEGGD